MPCELVKLSLLLVLALLSGFNQCIWASTLTYSFGFKFQHGNQAISTAAVHFSISDLGPLKLKMLDLFAASKLGSLMSRVRTPIL